MPYEIFAVPALICFAIGFYKGIKLLKESK
jgi:hypothetical protein